MIFTFLLKYIMGVFNEMHFIFNNMLRLCVKFSFEVFTIFKI